jgi:flagellar biosynthesis protein FlhA
MGYSRGMGVLAAIQTYSILSIGDGLVSQIPSVIISVSSGFLVTKISSNHSVGQDISKQFLKAGQPLMTAAFIIGAMSLVPGMPKIPFLLLAAGTAAVGRMVTKAETMPAKSAPAPQKKAEKEPVEELLDMDRVSVHVGVRLISMVDPRKSNTIFDRIGALRRQFAQQLGIVIPLVRLRDDLNLEPNAYEIRLCEIPVAKGFLEPDMFLAMDSGLVQQKIDGIKTTEPVYGLPALWIQSSKKEAAELNGYTVIDPESVFITHLSETLRRHADEMLTREDVQLLIDRLRKNQPSLVGEVVGTEGEVSTGILQRVLRNLLRSGIPIRELTAILEALAENASKTKNVTTLTEVVRKSLSRTITEQYRDAQGRVYAIAFDPSFEHQLTSSLRQEGGELILGIPADTAVDLNRKVADAWKSVMDQGRDTAILLCDARLRAPLAQMLARSLPMLPVVAYVEIVLGTDVQPVATVSTAPDEMTIRGQADCSWHRIHHRSSIDGPSR